MSLRIELVGESNSELPILGSYHYGDSYLGTWEYTLASLLRTQDARKGVYVMGDVMRENFGGYIVALIVVILAYTAVSIYAPQYTTGFAVVTLLGIVLFYFNTKKEG